jgi:hypothetical protein
MNDLDQRRYDEATWAQTLVPEYKTDSATGSEALII